MPFAVVAVTTHFLCIITKSNTAHFALYPPPSSYIPSYLWRRGALSAHTYSINGMVWFYKHRIHAFVVIKHDDDVGVLIN